MTTKVILPGARLAPICFNTHAMVPARAPFKGLMLGALEGRVYAAATDTYAGGFDMADATVEGPEVAVAVSRDTMEEIEQTARRKAGKKETNVILTLAPDKVTLTYPEDEESTGTEEWETEPFDTESWDAFFAILERDFGDTRPEFLAFDPALLSRFAKVKTSQDRVMDLWFAGDGEPVLVKVGPTFVGLAMPLDRERAGEYSPQGLWTPSRSAA